MKKMYKHPKMEVAPVAPMNIVCTSAGEGEGGTDALGPGKQTTDAPKRRTSPF